MRFAARLRPSRTVRAGVAALGACWSTAFARADAADPPKAVAEVSAGTTDPVVDLSEDDFKTYHGYLDALSDPRVQKLKESQRLAAIAHNFKVAPGKLQAIVARGERWPNVAAIGKACEAQIRRSLEGTPLAGRVDHLEVDVDDEHVVTYVSWRAEDLDKLDEEAVLLAAKAKKAAPISADLRLWAFDPQDKEHKVFDGLISGEAAGRFQEARIPDFAKTRYLKIFQTAKFDRP